MTSRPLIFHEATTRILCRSGFVLLGVAPLVYCFYVCLLTILPGYERRQADRWQRELTQAFGLVFSIDQASSLAPQHYRLSQVEIRHPETNRRIGLIESVELKNHLPQGWKIELVKPELQLDQIASSSQIFHQWYVSRSSIGRVPVNVTADHLILQDAHESIQLRQFAANVWPNEHKWALKAEFIPVSGLMPEGLNANQPPSQLLVERVHDPQNAKTGLQLKLDTAISCSALAKLLNFPTESWLQPMITSAMRPCQFAGVLDLRVQPSQETCYYFTNATVSHLDLGILLAGSDSLISGIGQLRLSQAKFNASRLDWAQGHLEVGAGGIDSAFLQAMSRHLDFTLQRPLSVGLIGFNRLAADFVIQPQSLQVVGACRPANDKLGGTIIEDAYGPIARRSEQNKLPIIALIHALAFRPDNPALPARITPLVRTAIAWLPLEDRQRREADELVIYR